MIEIVSHYISSSPNPSIYKCATAGPSCLHHFQGFLVWTDEQYENTTADKNILLHFSFDENREFSKCLNVDRVFD